MNPPLALPLGRRCAWLGLMLCGPVYAEAIKVDESKLPEWVKRQAAMPYRVIIQSPTSAPTAPAAPGVRRPAPLPRKPAAAPAIAGSGEAAQAASPAAADIEAPAPASPMQADAGPAPADPALPQPADPPPTLAAASPRALPSAAEAAAPLMLVERVEPSVSGDLLASALGELKVTVAFTVQPDGQVADAQVLSNSDLRLNRAVLRALRAWRYAPIPQARQHAISFAFVTQP